MVCAHMQDGGHQGVKATLHRLEASCAWVGKEYDGTKLVTHYLHCVESRRGNMVPRSLGEVIRGVEVGNAMYLNLPQPWRE